MKDSCDLLRSSLSGCSWCYIRRLERDAVIIITFRFAVATKKKWTIVGPILWSTWRFMCVCVHKLWFGSNDVKSALFCSFFLHFLHIVSSTCVTSYIILCNYLALKHAVKLLQLELGWLITEKNFIGVTIDDDPASVPIWQRHKDTKLSWQKLTVVLFFSLG